MATFSVGIIGAGNKSGAYLKGCSIFPVLKLKAIADVDISRAEKQAATAGIQAMTPEALLADPSIDIVVNITPPAFHAPMSKAALEAGKSVYSEKPLATSFADGLELVKLAEAKGLHLGCAPDTFLGGGLQTCRKLLDEGIIGKPVAAQGFFVGHGPEAWHPDPEFFYKPGAGPLFDIGPYLITTMIHFFGPIKRITASASIGLPERMIGSEPKKGQVIKVETPTHVSGLLDFASGVNASLTTSFEVWSHRLPYIEIYGTEGTLNTPDPNQFGGTVLVRRAGEKDWKEYPLSHDYTENTRGLGVADMAHAMRSGRVHRASGRMALHTLETMETILKAAQAGQRLSLSTSSERPQPFPTGMTKGTLDD
jgi:predicted dehydrogenase